MSLQSQQTDLIFDQELIVSVNLDIGQNNYYYLRGEFRKSGSSSNYCGFTWNENNWYNGPYTTNNGWLNLRKIKVESSSWSGILKAKIDPNDSGCKESGIYSFKIQRYTEGGSPGSDDTNELSINITLPTPTPIPTPDPTPEPTSTPKLDPTVTPKPTPTKFPTPKPTIKLITAKTDEIASSEGDVLGENIVSSSSPILDKTGSNLGKSSQNYLGWIFFVSGILLSSAAGILAFQKLKEGQLLV